MAAGVPWALGHGEPDRMPRSGVGGPNPPDLRKPAGGHGENLAIAIALNKKTALRPDEMLTDCVWRENILNLSLPDSGGTRPASVFVPMVSGKGRVGGLPRSGATTRPSESRRCGEPSGSGSSAIAALGHSSPPYRRATWPFWAVWIAAMLRLSIKHKQTTVGGRRTR